MVFEFPGEKIGVSRGRLTKLIGKLSRLSETDRTMGAEVRRELLSAVDELCQLKAEVGFEGEQAVPEALIKRLGVGEIQFDGMLKTVDLMAIVLDREGQILSCNDFFLNRTGWMRDEVVGRNWFETFVPAEQAEERRGRYLGRIQNHLRCSCYQVDVLTREKRRLQFIWNDSFLCDSAGDVVGMAGIGEDVTERRRLEEELKRQWEDYQVIFDSVPALIWYLDREGKILRINKPARRVMEGSEGAVCHRSLSEMFPEAGERMRGEIEAIVRTGNAIRNTVEKLVLASGEIRWLMTDKIPYAGESGLVMGVILFAKDITASREKDEALRESQRKLATLMSNLPGMAYRCKNDHDYTMEFVSEGCKTLTGYDSEDLIRNRKVSWGDIIHREDLARVWSQIQTAVREHRPFQLEYRMIFADGREKWVWEQGSGVFSPEGTVVALEGFIADITQRKKAEKALRESESQLKSVLSSLVDIVFGFDKEGRFIFCNCPPESKLLVPPEVFMGRKHSEILPPHIDDIFCKGFEKCQAGEIPEYDYSLELDGELRWFSVKMSPTFLNDTFVGAVALVRDVTAKKKADEAVRESEGKYRLLAENIMDVIWTVDLDRRFTYVSPSVVYLLGYSVDEVLAMKMEDLATPSSLELVLNVIAEEFALWQKNPELWPRSRMVEVELVRKDGSIIWVEVRASFAFNTVGEVVGISGIARDVTEQRKVQEALRESEGRYRSFVKNFQGIAFRADEKFHPVFMHGAVEAITGYKEEEFLAGTVRWDCLIHPDDIGWMNQEVNDVSMESELSRQWEYRIIDKKGKIRWLREMVQIIPGSTGEGRMFQGAVYDITDNKRIEAELSDYRENMVQADRLASLGTMGATIAHQLNQPLTVIRLFLQQSLRALPKECCGRVRENLNDSLAEVSNAIGIINRYLTFSRRQSDESIGTINLCSIAEKIVTVLNESARKANVELRVKDLDRLPEIEGYSGDIEQIFFTLIQNAIQAAEGKKKSRLVIRGRTIEDQVELLFEDTCSGIDPKDMEKIFEPFFTTKSLGQGTGLGLCILQRMVSKHGGKVGVESELGQGTTFRIMLPVRF